MIGAGNRRERGKAFDRMLYLRKYVRKNLNSNGIVPFLETF